VGRSVDLGNIAADAVALTLRPGWIFDPPTDCCGPLKFCSSETPEPLKSTVVLLRSKAQRDDQLAQSASHRLIAAVDTLSVLRISGASRQTKRNWHVLLPETIAEQYH
jgi:hypothetical protein